MVNTPGISGQCNSDKEEDRFAEGSPDNRLPENSQENLDSRLDHAIEETFPTSDPVSVTITKGPAPDQEARSSSGPDEQERQEHDTTEQVWIRCGKPCPR